jgi:catechol 2,3-dioxygenase-like lactoylglutathione lyase family enzyme
MFHPAAPILRVADLRASVDYYVNILGFKVDFETEWLVSVSRDRCCIFLALGDQGNPGAWVWIGVADAEAFMTCILPHPPEWRRGTPPRQPARRRRSARRRTSARCPRSSGTRTKHARIRG